MKFSINGILSAVRVMVTLAVAFVLFVSVSQSAKMRDTSESDAHTREVISRIQKLLLTVLDNETGAREYMIADKDTFLYPLRQLEKDLHSEIAAIRELVSNNPSQIHLSDSIHTYIGKQIDFLRTMIAARDSREPEAARKMITNGVGKSYTDRIRQLANEMETEEYALLAAQKKKNENSIALLNYFLYGVLAAAFILSTLIIYRIRSYIKKQRLNEQKFSALLDAAPDATVIVNEEGLIQMINQQVENLFGYTRREIISQPVEILIPRELRDRHIAHRSGFVKEARVRPMGAGIELKAIKKDGSSFPVEISLSPIETIDGLLVSASIRDITARKKAEEKFRSLLDSAPDATIIVNEEGSIQMVNRQTENLFEYTKEELLGKPVEILMPAELREKHIQHRTGFAQMPKVRYMGAGIELNAVKKNGIRFPVEISLSPIETEEGMLVSASVRDITFRKELENELKKSHAEMEAFTYSVSHDLRAPLRGIIGFTAILEEDYANKLDDEAKRITAVIRNNTLKMGHLIDDLLAFSRMGKQEIVKTPVNPKILVQEIVEEMKRQQKTCHRITWDIRALSPVNADLNTLRQVWINLISNAVKYTATREPAAIEIGSYFEDGYAVFYVKDNGVGFDEQYKHKLFRVFQRLHDAEQFEGTGVGLALVEKIISRHGGKVWAEGREEEGACFYFSLPL